MTAEEMALYQMGVEQGIKMVKESTPAEPVPGKAAAEAEAERVEQTRVLEGLESQYASLMHAKNFPQALIVRSKIKTLRDAQ